MFSVCVPTIRGTSQPRFSFAHSLLTIQPRVSPLCVSQNSEKELFPLKMRDLAINQSFAFLKSKKLMPEEDEDDFDMGEM